MRITTFGEAVQLLQDMKNEIIILRGDREEKQVLVSPQMVGRVMVSTMHGLRGDILGWVNRPAVEAGPNDPNFNNYGGEERIWLGPDGTQRGLFFKDTDFTWESFRIPQPMSVQPFETLGVSADGKSVAMRTRWEPHNLMGTAFRVEIRRTVSILEACPYANEFGADVDFVGFQSDNTVINVSDRPILRETGPLTVWLLGHYLPHKRCIVIVPFQPGPEAKLGPPLRDEFVKFFCIGSKVPANLRWYGNDYALIKADCATRCKFGIGRPRAIGRSGSMDLDTNELVIVDNDFYPEMDYATNYWRKADDLFDGDAVNICIDGPAGEEGPVFSEPDNMAYEIENVSPALFLHPGQSYVSRARTFRLRGKQEAIDAICRRFLRAEREILEAFDAQSGSAAE